MAVKEMTSENFHALVSGDKPVLVDFFATWCGPCKMMAPIVEKMAEELDGKVKVGKCNIDENMTLAARYRISSIPAFVIFKNGSPEATFVGAMSAAELKEKVEQALR